MTWRRLRCENGVYSIDVAIERTGPTSPRENIHHRNGDRTDNRVGPCVTRRYCDCSDGPHNLELWTTPQRGGQRAGDLVQYAVETLRRYAPELLR